MNLTVGNLEQKIIFFTEMAGQISDGFWEDAKPEDHRHPWSNLRWEDVIIDPNHIGTEGIPFGAKRNYNFSSRQLLDFVGTRIRVYVVFAKLYPDVILKLYAEYKHHSLPYSACEASDELTGLGITTEMIADVFNKLDVVYPYKAMRKDCKALKKAFRYCKEFPPSANPEPDADDEADDVTPTQAPTKPKCKLTGANGNVFNLMALASGALRKAGLIAQEQEMVNKVMKAESYTKAVAILEEYVDVK